MLNFTRFTRRISDLLDFPQIGGQLALFAPMNPPDSGRLSISIDACRQGGK
ncbi:MAG: hypothetical protein KGN31_07915 [Betaproteobacteria bacterium]|nr:hypothetical protein [Betaproteobacteria bacterium]MDE2424119.1 hypothetical protein [Betaproteobacteria bacterium]